MSFIKRNFDRFAFLGIVAAAATGSAAMILVNPTGCLIYGTISALCGYMAYGLVFRPEHFRSNP